MRRATRSAGAHTYIESVKKFGRIGVAAAALGAFGVCAVGTSTARGDVVVLEYRTYCVGPRADLYAADWRLRNAQCEQWRAQEALDAARLREGELALAV